MHEQGGLLNQMKKEKENLMQITTETYQQHFHRYIDSMPKDLHTERKIWRDSFVSLLPQGASILELGSASGQDAQYFSSKGLFVLCTDIIQGALKQLSDQGFQTERYDFRDPPKPEWQHQFDGFYANAVLLHATPEIFRYILETICFVVKENGIIAFSVKAGEGDEVSFERMNAPRYFKYYQETELHAILSQFPFQQIHIALANQGQWLQVLMKKGLPLPSNSV